MRPHLMCACMCGCARMQIDRWINGWLDSPTHSRTNTNKHAYARAHTLTHRYAHRHAYAHTYIHAHAHVQHAEVILKMPTYLKDRDTDRPCQDAKHKILNAVAAARPRRIWSLLSPRSRPHPHIAIAHRCESATGLHMCTGVSMYAMHVYIRRIESD